MESIPPTRPRPSGQPAGDLSRWGAGRFDRPAEGSEEEAGRRQVLNFIGVLKRRRNIIGGSILAGLLLAVLAMFIAEPRYTAGTQILMTPRGNNIVELSPDQVPVSADSQFVDNQVEVLKSATLMGRVIDKMKLGEDPRFNADLVEGRSLLSWLDPRTWLELITRPAVPSDPAVVEERQRLKLIRQLSEDISIRRIGLSYLVQISATSRSPELSRDISNTLVDLYLVEELETQVDGVRRTNSWLDAQLEELRSNLQTAEQALETYRIENNLVDAGGQTMTEQQRGDMNAQLMLARADLAEKQARYQRVASLVQSGGDVQTMSDVLSSETIVRLRQQQAEVARRQAELSSRYGELHPQMVNIRAELRDIEGQIASEARRIVSKLGNDVAVSRSRVNSLAGAMSSLNVTAAGDQQALIKLRELERDANSNRQLYESLLEGYKRSFVMTNSDTLDPPARVTALATLPLEPSHPDKKLFLALGLLLGALAGMAISVVLDALERGFRDSDSAEKFLGASHLASVPMVPQKDLKEADCGSIPQFTSARPTSVLSESLRKLRSALVFSDVDDPPRVLSVTSALPGEGKTTLSCVLANSLALSGYRTLLIDADLRHPNVAKTIALGEEQTRHGLAEVLAGEVTLGAAIVQHESVSCDILAGRSRPPNSADLLDSRAMADLVANARGAYDYVSLDSAPVMPIVDPLVLSRHVDAVIFSVRWEQTPRDAALAAIRKLRGANARIAGFVLNVVDLRKMARNSLSYGEEGYYVKQYGKYYNQERDAA